MVHGGTFFHCFLMISFQRVVLDFAALYQSTTHFNLQSFPAYTIVDFDNNYVYQTCLLNPYNATSHIYANKKPKFQQTIVKRKIFEAVCSAGGVQLQLACTSRGRLQERRMGPTETGKILTNIT